MSKGSYCQQKHVECVKALPRQTQLLNTSQINRNFLFFILQSAKQAAHPALKP